MAGQWPALVSDNKTKARRLMNLLIPSKYTPDGDVTLRAPESDEHGATEKSNNDKRYRRILEAGASAVISKGAVLLVNLISVPIAVRYLGSVGFGLWTTISTSLSLLLVLDIGIANTLTNLISEAYAREDKRLAGAHATTAFWLMSVVALVLGLTGSLAWRFINWGYVFDVNASLRGVASSAVAVAFAVFLIGMPAGLAAKLLGGYQELRTANLFAAAGSVGSLVGIVLVVRLHGGLATLVGASSGSLVLANGVCLLWIWLKHKPWLAPWPSNLSVAAGRRLFNTGSQFFLLQLTGLVVFNSDNLVIAHFAGPAFVTPYSVTWRLVSYASVFQMLMFPALWPAYSEAYVRGDMQWVRKTYWRVMKLTTYTAGAFCIILLALGRVMIHYWAGDAAMPAQSLVIAMCVWVMISTVMGNAACLLAATNEIRLQTWLSATAAILNLVLTIWLVQRIGILGVILGTVLSYLIVIVGPITWKVSQVLQGAALREETRGLDSSQPRT